MKNQLSTNFSLDEFTNSATAMKHGICNEAPVEVISNLQNLCQQVLQPVRDHLGVPVVITSGYRCRALNRLVGCVPNSQHITGEAADAVIVHSSQSIVKSSQSIVKSSQSIVKSPQSIVKSSQSIVKGAKSRVDIGLMKDAFEWIRLNCDFDQLIWEQKNGRTWIHVSCCRKTGKNRKQVIYPKR